MLAGYPDALELLHEQAPLEVVLAEVARSADGNLRVVEALYRVGQAINASLDLQEVVQVVTDAATELAGAEFGAFFYNVVGDDGESYMLYTLSGVPREAFERFPQPRNTQIFGPTFRGEGVVRLDDVTADPRYGRNDPYHGMPPGHLPVRSYLAVPVVSSDGSVLGGLFFGHSSVGVFTEEKERMTVAIAAQAAIAIEKSWLYVQEQNARTEAEARASAALSLEHIDDGVALVGDDGVARVWNAAAERIVGTPATRVLGHAIAEAVPGWRDLAQQVQAASTTPVTVPLEHRDRELWLSVASVDFSGGTVYTFRDVTRERDLEQVRADLVATVSHELRTPLAAVYGAAKTLARTDLDGPSAAKLVQMIEVESERLRLLVDEILLASRLERESAFELAFETFDAGALAASVVAASRAAGRDGEIVLDVPDHPVHAAADVQRTRQVLANLVDNALKYGGGTIVRVDVATHERRVVFCVADGGPGIPRQDQDRIFEKFFRLDPKLAKGVSGTGLGLYIARELVQRMGGRIWLESDEGAGAAFFVQLPAA